MSSCITPLSTLTSEKTQTIYRIQVSSNNIKNANIKEINDIGQIILHATYWLNGNITQDDVQKIATEILVDHVIETASITQEVFTTPKTIIFQKTFMPGVTDNLAHTVKEAIYLLFPTLTVDVVTGQTIEFLSAPRQTVDELKQLLAYKVYNPLIEHLDALSSETAFYFPTVVLPTYHSAETISLNIPDENLLQLSQSRCLALNLEELKSIQQYYQQPELQALRQNSNLPADAPTDVELEIIAQTWSEHCKHKIFNAEITYTDASIPEHEYTEVIDSLFKTCIYKPTELLRTKRNDLLSIFVDNAGIVRWNDDLGLCFKVETHNSPSALEPYGGAMTGIVGVNRDILGTGLGAKPIANTNVFCFAHPEMPYLKHPRLLPPETILQGVRKGVEDGGNKSGIPTVNGSIFFDPRYRAKPLVYCGTTGILPLEIAGKKAYEKHTQVGDTIVMAGGRVGKDGIHGATFSSEALHEASPVTAVQIGDPFTQKRLSDFLMIARDQGLISGITDNGAGGLSSSIGEMAEITGGAKLNLEKVPLKYLGLLPYEIVISESQERMTISTNNYDALHQLASKYEVEITAIGEFTNSSQFEIYMDSTCVASLNLQFLHHGLPQLKLNARWEPEKHDIIVHSPPNNANKILLNLLSHPNICSREVVIRQYDHEVQGRSVIKPLVGVAQRGPADAAVLVVDRNKPEGLVLSNGLCPQYSDWDTYHMACCAVDEAVRNAVAVGCDPSSITLLDNFCWPDPVESQRNTEAEHKLAQLVRACKGIHDIALAYETPFISGKDSMKNDFDDGSMRLSIPPTLLISAMGKVPDIAQAVSMEWKIPGDIIYLLGHTGTHMGGSHYYQLMGWHSRTAPQVAMGANLKLYKTLHQAILNGWVHSCHDLSEGGLAVALAECTLANGYGATIDICNVKNDSPELRWDEILFSETPGRFVISVTPDYSEEIEKLFEGQVCLKIGEVSAINIFDIRYESDDIFNDEDTLVSLGNQELVEAWSRSPAKCWQGAIE